MLAEIAAALVLPPDVVLVPTSELPLATREQLRCDEGDVAVTRPRGRSGSRIVDARGAALLLQFKVATPIVTAVLRYSQIARTDPFEVLESAFPMLRGLVAARMLTPVDSSSASEIIPSLEIGGDFGPYTVIDCIQVLEDTELYQARSATGALVALKVARPSEGVDELQGRLEREAAVLRLLDGTVTPRLEGEGRAGRTYVATEWREGAIISTAADDMRWSRHRDGGKRLLELCAAVARAYSSLHAQGVLHGDVHPRNVLVDAAGSVSLVDFGFADIVDKLPASNRGGVGFFFEPEYADACLRGVAPPPASAAGEQYAVGALLYFLCTGGHYCNFTPERTAMFRQICEELPLPFARHGVEPMQPLEDILARALAKDPLARFATMEAFADALAAVAPAIPPRASTNLSSATGLARLAAMVREQFTPRGELFLDDRLSAPRCSVNYGAAGVAYGLYRMAMLREEDSLLADADLWANRAVQRLDREDAFVSKELDITPEITGAISPYHTESGVHCVRALIANSLGDQATFLDAIERFVARSRLTCANLDLTLGRSGVLVASAMMLEIADGDAASHVRALGDDTCRAIWDELDVLPPISECDSIHYLGIAHGWAGLVYATLLWCSASGQAPPANAAIRLRELEYLAQPFGRGLRWPIRPPDRKQAEYMTGWCHGSSGYIHLWLLAAKLYCEDRYLSFAERAGWAAWEATDRVGSICCGSAGRAYGLLALFRQSGDREWIARASRLADLASNGIRSHGLPPDSLYKGELGIAVLAEDILRPEWSALPFFDSEHWRP